MLQKSYSKSRLRAFRKSSGGIRHIAISYTWRRIAANCTDVFNIQKMSNYLSLIQLVVGVAGGTEADVYSLRRYVSTMGDDDIKVKLDFAKAFNIFSRDTLMETMAMFIPEIYCFVHTTYFGKPILNL